MDKAWMSIVKMEEVDPSEIVHCAIILILSGDTAVSLVI